MARLTQKSLTRWENGVPVTYFQGDDVPDLKASTQARPNVFLTREEGARPKAVRPVTPSATKKEELLGETEADTQGSADIIGILEGNAESVKAYIAKVDRIDLLEEILVAEGEGKNRSTVRAAVEDRIKTLEEQGEG